MGTIHHTAIIVTGSDFSDNAFTKAYAEAKRIFPEHLVSEMGKKVTNGYSTFTVHPCGSKIGWDTSNQHLASVDDFVSFLNSLKYEDGSTSVPYVVVSFGELGLQVRDSEDRNVSLE